MKKHIIKALVAVALISGGYAAAEIVQHVAAGDDNAVNSLTCEGLVDPIAVNTLSPRLSWKLPSQWQQQSAYEIEVGSNPEALANGGAADLWQSGKVGSSQSVHVKYAGEALSPGMQAWWRVRLWNQDGNISDWSPVARFGIGYVDGANTMPGEYIGISGSGSKGPKKYLMIPNTVLTDLANHRYLADRYLTGIDYPVSYLGYSMVDKLAWKESEIDRVEVHFNVLTPSDAVIGKQYRLEMLAGDEENYVQFKNLGYDYTTKYNGDSRLLQNGTFDSDDAVGTIGSSIKKVFAGRFGPITITGEGAVQAPEALDVNNDESAVYYDLQGRRVNHPSTGIYIKSQGQTSTKVKN